MGDSGRKGQYKGNKEMIEKLPVLLREKKKDNYQHNL